MASNDQTVADRARLDTLDAYDVLDTPPEPGFDDIVRLACRLCEAPVALVSLVAGDRQWFKARVNFPQCQTDLNSSVCAHALTEPDRLLVIPDLTLDVRTSANPLVTGEPFLRFYAGAPLVASDGQVLGSVCVIDHRPRPRGLTEAQAEDLSALARQVMTQLNLRRSVSDRDAANREQSRAALARDALRDAQAAVAEADGDLDGTLEAVVRGAMAAVPLAEGGVVEMIQDGDLVYRAVAGSLSPQAGLRVPLPSSLAGRCATARIPLLMSDAATDPYVHRDLAARVGLRSAIVAPILRSGVVLGVLKLQSSDPGVFRPRDLDMISLFTGVATTGLAAAEARAQAREKDVHWRRLFDRLGEGFQIIEAVRDEAGRVVDWRYLEANPAWAALAGVPAETAIGRTMREVFHGVDEGWIDDFARVEATGEALAFEREFSVAHRWYRGQAFPLDDGRVGALFSETSERIAAERRRDALLALGDRLRDLGTVAEMTRAASGIVGEALGVSCVGYGRIDGDLEYVTIEPGWTASGMQDMAGRHRYGDVGWSADHLRRGEPLVIDDVATDPRTRYNPGSIWQLGIGAMVDMPVRERGRTVAVLIVHDMRARTWGVEELAFLRNVADRVAVGVARLHAEERQAILNRELSHRLKNTLAIVQSIAVQTLRGVTERDLVQAFDRRLLALSRAHDILLRKDWSAADMRAVTEGVLAMQADLARFSLTGPDIDVGPDAAMSLSLLLHELGTNAIKYGALSTQAGRVDVAWGFESGDGPKLVLRWTESGGPAVSTPGQRVGFGSKLIRMGLLGTRMASIEYASVGLRAEFRAPLADVLARDH